MYQRAFATVADAEGFPGLWTLLNSVYAYHGTTLRAFAFLHGSVEDATERALGRHALGAALTVVPVRESAEPLVFRTAAPQLLERLTGRARVVFLLEADSVLLSSMDDAFAEAEGGRLVASGAAADLFEGGCAALSPRLAGTRFARLSPGFLCLDLSRHWDLVALWSFAVRHAHAGGPLRALDAGGREALDVAAALAGKADDLGLHDENDWRGPRAPGEGDDYTDVVERAGLQLFVRNRETSRRQRLLHARGRRWWAPEGREGLSAWRDFCAVFRHFSGCPWGPPCEP